MNKRFSRGAEGRIEMNHPKIAYPGEIVPTRCGRYCLCGRTVSLSDKVICTWRYPLVHLLTKNLINLIIASVYGKIKVTIQ